jgi:hypothetical protein
MARVRSLVTLALATLTAAACGGTTATPNSGTTASETRSWRLASGPQLDILFMIDNSSSMSTAQANLRANLGNFMDVLKQLPGGLPDLHIAVVTSDMGAGDGASIQGCTTSGDNGVFRFQPTGGCTATGLDPGATFITDTGGTNPITNFGSQDITTVLQCIVEVGSTGCGFQHQLGAVARALGADGTSPPPQNASFLRPDALLAIILITGEDDCSGPPGDTLFNPTSSALSSMFGPTENFLCNEWGHLCTPPGGGPPVQPSRFAPNNLATDAVVYTPAMAAMSNCQSFEQSPVLTSVRSIADGIKSLKADPANQVMVTAFVGLNEGPSSNGYKVTWRTAPTADTGPWPQIAHACGSEASPTGYADPAVRIEQFVGEFGNNGLADNFCQANYSAALATIATKLSVITEPPCLEGQAATKPNTTTPDCTVTESVPNPNDPLHPVVRVLPVCGTIPIAPCWTLTPPTAMQAPTCPGFLISLFDGGTPPPGNAIVSATCAICVAPDPSRGCP